MISLYFFPTPNGVKPAIMLEETGLEYETRKVDIRQGEQFTPEFLAINPNNKMRALIDHAPEGGGAPVTVFESGAMLEYLADKTGQFLAKSGAARYAAIQWVQWQMANLGPMVGNAAHFKNYAPFLTEDKAAIAYGDKRYSGEVNRNCGVMESQLSRNAWLAGDEYSIADMAAWPWVNVIPKIMGDPDYLAAFPSVARWWKAVGERPAVARASNLHLDWRTELTEEEEAKRRRTLFNQDAQKVAAVASEEKAARSTAA